MQMTACKTVFILRGMGDSCRTPNVSLDAVVISPLKNNRKTEIMKNIEMLHLRFNSVLPNSQSLHISSNDLQTWAFWNQSFNSLSKKKSLNVFKARCIPLHPPRTYKRWVWNLFPVMMRGSRHSIFIRCCGFPTVNYSQYIAGEKNLIKSWWRKEAPLKSAPILLGGSWPGAYWRS